MGRHADPDARHFWRSLGTASLRATVALALVVGLFAALSSIGRVPEDGPVILGGPEPGSQGAPASPEPPPEAQAPPDGAPAPTPHATDERVEPADVAADSPEALIAAAPPPAETTVQVLDGVGQSLRLTSLVGALEDLGYDIVATNPAATNYPVTTVLFTEGSEDAARALQARDSRIAERRASPGLSTEVDLHVVLGADWEP